VDFSNKVFLFCQKIPSGKVTTYSELARVCGSKKAVRAVGNILNKNRDFNNVPCHRVVCKNGEIGGYVFGTKKKKDLLKKEGVIFVNETKVNLDKCLFRF